LLARECEGEHSQQADAGSGGELERRRVPGEGDAEQSGEEKACRWGYEKPEAPAAGTRGARKGISAQGCRLTCIAS
jgi:hypothetical protein